jgi:hypothetical protein
MEPAQSEQTTIGAAASLQTRSIMEDLQGETFAGGANLKGTFDGSVIWPRSVHRLPITSASAVR